MGGGGGGGEGVRAQVKPNITQPVTACPLEAAWHRQPLGNSTRLNLIMNNKLLAKSSRDESEWVRDGE